MLCARALLVVLLVAGGRAGADPARLAVDFACEDWFCTALEQTVARELSRFQSLALADKLDVCPGRDTRCLVDKYRQAGIDLVVLGRLGRERLDYEVYATWMAGRAFDGKLTVAHVDAASLRRHIGDLARPIVQRGGLADEKPPAASPVPAVTTPIGTPPEPHRLLLLALFAGIMV